jgi:hypothetical protein
MSELFDAIYKRFTIGLVLQSWCRETLAGVSLRRATTQPGHFPESPKELCKITSLFINDLQDETTSNCRNFGGQMGRKTVHTLMKVK